MGSPLFKVRVVVGLAQGLNTLSRLATSYVMLLLFYRFFGRIFKFKALIGWMQIAKVEYLSKLGFAVGLGCKFCKGSFAATCFGC